MDRARAVNIRTSCSVYKLHSYIHICSDTPRCAHGQEITLTIISTQTEWAKSRKLSSQRLEDTYDMKSSLLVELEAFGCTGSFCDVLNMTRWEGANTVVVMSCSAT